MRVQRLWECAFPHWRDQHSGLPQGLGDVHNGRLLVGREAAAVMRPRHRGSIIFTGASASLRSSAGFAAVAGGKHALRALAQSVARHLGPEGLHIARVIIDDLIDNANS